MKASRRGFIRRAAALAAVPASIRKALAIPAFHETGTLQDVKHVVILTQENRAFDHYFGTLKGVRGFGDRFTIPQPGGRSVWEQLDRDGRPVRPYPLDATQGNAQRAAGVPHSWVDGQQGWLDGRLGYWAAAKGAASMAYFRQAELPFQFALAEAFTVCDAYHCAMHAGTTPNRLFLWTGTNGPAGARVAALDNEWDDIGPADRGDAGYDWTTYPERLQAAGVRWIVYQNMPDNFGDNPLAGFRRYRAANRASGKPVGSEGGPFPAYDPATDDAGNPLYKGIANTMPGPAGDVESQLRQFREDCSRGRLPQVAWVVAPAAYSEHPGPSSPAQGAWYIQQVLDALTANPDVWSRTVLFINFDENDGYFDHLPSPAAPSRNADGTLAGKTTLAAAELAFEYNTYPSPPGSSAQPQPGGRHLDYGTRDGRVFGPGPRVPMYVVSPWSRGGWVHSQALDHTSVIRFLEARFGVVEPHISPFRRAVMGDLTGAFNFADPNHEPLPTLAGRQTRAGADALRLAQQALPPIAPAAGRGLPLQAAGWRPSRALPYELHCTALVEPQPGRLRLRFRNTGRAAAVFHVYDQRSLDAMPGRQPWPAEPRAWLEFRDRGTPAPRRYMVQPQRQLDDHWAVPADGVYDLWVLGPNGFHRRFSGSLAASPEVRATYDAQAGGLRLEARNDGTAPVVLQVRSNRLYGRLGAEGSGTAGGSGTAWAFRFNGPGEQALYWNLEATGGWYDLQVTSDADPAYLRRLAGRLETGRHSVSDPAMGGIDSF